MSSFLEARAREAQQKVAFYTGRTDLHPQGSLAASRVFLIPEDDRRMWDTSPRAWRFSEYGNAAGLV